MVPGEGKEKEWKLLCEYEPKDDNTMQVCECVCVCVCMYIYMCVCVGNSRMD